jgi:geranylgeranyl pyrophosphate synthase
LNKTAALITCSLVMGARIGCAGDATVDAVRMIGSDLGLAFQIVDDILDSTSDSQTLGKTAGIDEVNGKLTYTAFYGLDKSRARARELTQSAANRAREVGGNTAFLLELIHHLEHRIN